jgi:hypothetical protein
MLTVRYAGALTDIRVNAADPGYTATDLNGHSGFLAITEGTDTAVGLATESPGAGATRVTGASMSLPLPDTNDPHNSTSGGIHVPASAGLKRFLGPFGQEGEGAEVLGMLEAFEQGNGESEVVGHGGAIRTRASRVGTSWIGAETLMVRRYVSAGAAGVRPGPVAAGRAGPSGELWASESKPRSCMTRGFRAAERCAGWPWPDRASSPHPR